MTASGRPTAQPVRVVIVLHDPADLAVVASVVAAHGFQLHVLESSSDLIEQVRRYQPDALVLDADGPGSYALCRAFKSDIVAAGVPVILIGALDGPDARRLAFAAGCDDFLEKPLNRHVFAYRVDALARLRAAWLRRALAIVRGQAARGGIQPAALARVERRLVSSQQDPEEVDP